jgi:hypothetical protein
MFDYEVNFKGGSSKYNNGEYKFHLYVTDSKGEEFHLYEALRRGLAEKRRGVLDRYSLAYPVVKLFTSTSGFGIPKEYFSYFVLVCPEVSSRLDIKPLGFKKIPHLNFSFSTTGRFLVEEEIKRLYGKHSNTYKFYSRQSFISRRRLLEMVTVTDRTKPEEVMCRPKVRKLRVE